jgi:hypothetical protein
MRRGPCTCGGTAPGYPQHESFCGQPETDDDDMTTAEVTLAAFPELRDTDYGRYLDSLTREAERWHAEFKADREREGKS